MIRVIYMDKRYKVDQDVIDSMRQMRLSGLSYAKIGLAHGVSGSTALYWIDEKQRLKQRKKNAKRAHSPKDLNRISRDMQKRRENWNTNPDMVLRHTIQSAKDEKRIKRKTVRGMPMKEAIKKLDSGELKTPNNKMRD